MLQWLREGDLYNMGFSSGPGLVWILVGVVTLQSNKSGPAAGSRGQVYTRGQTVPNHVAPKWKFQECETSVNLYWVMLHVIQLPGWCSSISSLLCKFTLLIRNRLRSWCEIDWEKSVLFPSKFSLVTHKEKCLVFTSDQLSISNHSQTLKEELEQSIWASLEWVW